MKDVIVVHHPADAVPLISQYGKKKQEHFGIICLDNQYNVISKKVLFIGGAGSCQIDTKVVFWEACRKSATAVIIFHTHPCGESDPSKPDIKTTKDLSDGFRLLGIQFLDHIIIGRHEYFSFLEHDMIETLDSKVVGVAEVK